MDFHDQAAMSHSHFFLLPEDQKGKKKDTGEAVRQIQGEIVFGEKRCPSGCFHGTTVSVEFRITIKQIQDREKCNKKLRNL